jgi:hypothetical protein
MVSVKFFGFVFGIVVLGSGLCTRLVAAPAGSHSPTPSNLHAAGSDGGADVDMGTGGAAVRKASTSSLLDLISPAPDATTDQLYTDQLYAELALQINGALESRDHQVRMRQQADLLSRAKQSLLYDPVNHYFLAKSIFSADSMWVGGGVIGMQSLMLCVILTDIAQCVVRAGGKKVSQAGLACAIRDKMSHDFVLTIHGLRELIDFVKMRDRVIDKLQPLCSKDDGGAESFNTSAQLIAQLPLPDWTINTQCGGHGWAKMYWVSLAQDAREQRGFPVLFGAVINQTRIEVAAAITRLKAMDSWDAFFAMKPAEPTRQATRVDHK